MIRPIIFAVCEKVILDKDSGATTLVALLETLTVAVPSDIDIEVEPFTQIPMPWVAFATWERGDAGDELYEQKVSIWAEAKDFAAGALTRFRFESRSHRTLVYFQSLPVRPGNYFVTLEVRKADEGEWEEAATYPLRVLNQPAKMVFPDEPNTSINFPPKDR